MEKRQEAPLCGRDAFMDLYLFERQLLRLYADAMACSASRFERAELALRLAEEAEDCARLGQCLPEEGEKEGAQRPAKLAKQLQKNAE